MSQEIAVIGDPRFTAGFRLAGVRRIEDITDEQKAAALDDAIRRVFADNVGIVVMHADDLDYLSPHMRELVETSTDPTVVTVGDRRTTDLQEKIKQALGIDLL